MMGCWLKKIEIVERGLSSLKKKLYVCLPTSGGGKMNGVMLEVRKSEPMKRSGGLSLFSLSSNSLLGRETTKGNITGSFFGGGGKLCLERP